MPAPITHIAHAQSFLSGHDTLIPDAFTRGTVFPDIRYLGVIERNKTHQFGYGMADIYAAPTAWESGRRYHNYVDDLWNKIAHEDRTFLALPQVPELTQALKMTEAMAINERMQIKITPFLTFDHESTDPWGIAELTLRRWHQFIVDACQATPDPKSQASILRLLGLDEIKVQAIIKLAFTFRGDPAIDSLLERLWIGVEDGFR